MFYIVMSHDRLEDCGNWLCGFVVTMALNKTCGLCKVDPDEKSEVRVKILESIPDPSNGAGYNCLIFMYDSCDL